MRRPVKTFMPAVYIIQDHSLLRDHIQSDPELYHSIADVSVADHGHIEERTE